MDLLAAGLITQAEFDAKCAADTAAEAAHAARVAQLEGLLSSGLITHGEYDDKLAANNALAAAPTAASSSSTPSPPKPPSEAELVRCEGCGESFLPHLRPKHERSCPAVRPAQKSVRFAPNPDEVRPLARPKQGQQGPGDGADATDAGVELPSVAHADNGSNSFVACGKCGRTFFPDRLPVHLRVCKGVRPGVAAAVGAPAAAAAPPPTRAMAQLDELLAADLITQAEYDAKCKEFSALQWGGEVQFAAQQ